MSDLNRPVEWRALLKGIDTVVHLAGITHAGPEIAEQAYARVNRLATAELAETSQRIGIRRLIFASSIRAQSGPVASRVLDENDTPQPTDAYGRSKLAAEKAVRASNVPFTILRPVLIYGQGVKGNLAKLARLARTPWPLPFGGFSNRRSLLARQNLIDAIHFSLRTPATMGETYVVADAEPVSLAEIIAALRAGEGRSPLLLPIPTAPIAAALKMLGQADIWERLGGELVVNPEKFLRAGWRPPLRSLEGLSGETYDVMSKNQG